MKSSPSKNKQGSVLIIAMILGLALASMVGGYLLLTNQAMKNTQRTFYMNTAFNLAESGAEYGIWCMKNTWTLPADSWTGDASTKTYIGSVNSAIFSDTQGAKGYFKVRVTQADTDQPTIVAEGVVDSGRGPVLTKQIRIQLKNATPWINNLDADKLSLSGRFGSYFSSLGSPSSSTMGYDLTVSSTTLEIGDFSVGAAATIYGSVAIGANAQAGFINSIQGEILGPSTAEGQAGVIKQGSNLIDTNRIAYDYTQDFPDVEVPAVGGAELKYSLPIANTQKIIEVGDKTGAKTYRYQLSSVDIPNGYTLMVVGPVEFDVATTFNVAGNAALVVLNQPDPTQPLWIATRSGTTTTVKDYSGVGEAKLYVKGDISISGNGSINAPYRPMGLQVYGTLTQAEYAAGYTQKVAIGGNGNLTAAFYAPNADVTMNGGGTTGYFAGGMVANTVKVNGASYQFWGDKDLEDLSFPNSYRVAGWAELTSSSDKYNFGG